MQFLLTDREALETIRNGIRRDDGLLLIRIPKSCFQASDEFQQFTLAFSLDSHTVHWGKHSVRLSPTLFALLQYVHQCGRVSFEDAQDTIWQRETTDTVIYTSCSRLSAKLLNAEIPYSVTTRHGSITLEEVTS